MTVAFVQEPEVAEPLRLQPFLRSSVDNFDWSGRPHLQSLSIAGPFNATGPGDTPSRRRIFACHPASRSAEEACAKQIVSTLARRAYRQPLTPADLQRVMGFYQNGPPTAGASNAGIEMALQRILASPKFLFRIERDPAMSPAGTAYRISDVELASRLSFFLWSSIPDDELLNAGQRRAS